MSDTKTKERFTAFELPRVLRKMRYEVKEAWYDEENGKEYIYIELECGLIRRVEVTGGGVAAILIDCAYALQE